MINQRRRQGSYFSDAARAAGLEVRRRKARTPALKDGPEVFAVHFPATAGTFSWEIRRFGSIVLQRGVEQFSTAAEARVAGEVAIGLL